MKLLVRYRGLSASVRTSIWFTVCNFLQRGCALLTTPIFTRLLTPAEYGICNLYFALFDVFILFTSLKLPYEGLNNGLIRHEDDPDGYTASMFGLISVLTCITGGLYFLLRRWIDGFTGLGGPLMAVLFVQLLFQPAMMLWTNRARFDAQYRIPVIVTLAGTVAGPVIAVLAVVLTPYAAEARIIALAAVQVCIGAVCAGVLLVRGKRLYRRDYWRFALSFNLPLLPYYLSQSLLGQSDRLMINYYEGSGKAALYSVAYTAGTLMQLAVSAVNGSLCPWMYKKMKAGAYGDIAAVVRLLCVLLGAGCLCMTAAAPDLIALLATEEYREAVWIVPPVSASVFFVFVYMMFANVEMYFGENRGISAVSLAAGTANVVLNAVCIPRIGYMAAGWTTLFSYMLLALLHGVLMRRACRRHGVRAALLPVGSMLAVSAGVVLLTLGMLALYRVPYLRYAVPALLLLAAALRGRQILRVLYPHRNGDTGTE